MAFEPNITPIDVNIDDEGRISLLAKLELRDHPERLYISDFQAPQPEDPDNPPDPPLPTNFIVDETFDATSDGIADVVSIEDGYIIFKNRRTKRFQAGDAIIGRDSECTATITKVGDAVVFAKTFTQRHNPGNNINVAGEALLDQMQEAAGRFIQSQNILNGAPLAQLIAQIENNLET